MTEKWAAVVGYEDHYEVSAQGNVRSLDREDSRGRKLKGRQLKPYLDKDGCPKVVLSLEGVCHCRRASRLVLEAFVGEMPEDFEARHLNGQPDDCHLVNLEWRSRLGESNSSGRIADADVPKLFKLREAGLTFKDIARQVGMSKAQVNKIINGRSRHREVSA